MIDFIGTVVEENFALIYFPHGLFFFAMGVAILAQHRKSNPFQFANHLWIMGIFALLHAFSEWFDVLIALQVASFDAETLFRVALVSGFAESLSYAVLFVFGLRLLIQGRSWVPWVVPTVLFAVWVVLVMIGFRTYQDPRETLTVAQVVSHYLLLIPSGLVAAWALRREANSAAAVYLPRGVRTAVRALAWIFVLVALVNGLFVKRGPFLPANIINDEAFRAVTGVDVQWAKGLIGTALMLVTAYLLVQFNRETDRLMAVAEANAVRFSERERIGQDLHDGVIQTLYATGMVLEATVRKMDDRSPARDNVVASIKGVNRSIQDLRNYIGGLSDSGSVQRPLRDQIGGMLDDLHASYGLATSLDYDVPSTLALASDRRSNLYFVVCELLNNVGKHAQASRVHVQVAAVEDTVRITISDDGRRPAPVDFWEKGIAPAGAGMGLRNMRTRLEELRGELGYSTTGDGHRVTLQVPKEMAVAA